MLRSVRRAIPIDAEGNDTSSWPPAAGGIDSHQQTYPFQVYRMRLHGQFEYDWFPSIQ